MTATSSTPASPGAAGAGADPPTRAFAQRAVEGRGGARRPANRRSAGSTPPASAGDERAVVGCAHKPGTYAFIESKSQAIIDTLSGAMLETQALKREVGQLKEAQAAAEREALSDSLTGLANRTLLADRVSQALRHLERSPGYVGVLMLDLDHFKVINDTLGHQVGDAVLVEAARRLQHLARPDDTVARFGGDEFVIVVQNLGDPADLTAFADRLVAGLRAPYNVEDGEVVATVSVGIAVASQPESLPVDLLREADMAMYRAKDRGRDRHEVYGAALQVRATERLEVERVVRRALIEDRLIVEYQPVVDVGSGAIVQVEALVRIDDERRGRLTPEHFLLVARETGLLAAMDDRVRLIAMAELAQWRTDPALAGVERLAVNLTARELANPQFATQLAARLEAAGLSGSDMSIEVTEHVLMQTSHSAVASLADLRDLGLEIGLDDFGTGFSALSYLQNFPLDFIKIDRSFIGGVAIDGRSAAIVKAMVDLAHALGLSVVAEGVETPEQLAGLRDLGCDRAQGYLFAHSLSAAELQSMVAC